MDRLIATGSVVQASADIAPATGTPGFATDGNPATNTPATQWPAYQYNAMQEELMAIIGASNITPDRTKNNQAVAAIKALLQSGAPNSAPDTGSQNALAVTLTPAPAALTVGMSVTVLNVAATNAGAATLNVNGLGVKPIVLPSGAALSGGEIYAGSAVEFAYTGSSWVLQTRQPDNGVPSMTFAQISALTANYGPIICSDRGGILYEWSGSAYVSQAATNAAALARVSAAALLTPAALGFAEQPVVTGQAVFTASNNNIQMTGIVAALALSVGDVIQITGTTSNNLTITVESIVDANNIITNAAHANGAGVLSLTNETAANATVTRIAKWYNAPLGLGQALVDLTSSRTTAVVYTSPGFRAIQIQISLGYTASTAHNYTLSTNGIQSTSSGSDCYSVLHGTSQYQLTGTGSTVLRSWKEFR